MKFFDWLKHRIEPKRTDCPGPDNIGVVGETDFLVLTYKRPLSNKQLEAIQTSVKQSGIRAVVVCCDEIYIQRNVETRACNPVKPTQPETRCHRSDGDNERTLHHPMCHCETCANGAARLAGVDRHR